MLGSSQRAFGAEVFLDPIAVQVVSVLSFVQPFIVNEITSRESAEAV